MVTQNHIVIPATVLEKFRFRGFPEGVTLTADHCNELDVLVGATGRPCGVAGGGHADLLLAGPGLRRPHRLLLLQPHQQQLHEGRAHRRIHQLRHLHVRRHRHLRHHGYDDHALV